ncbi:MAG: DNA polymerase Y family protein [Burkholderiaceae bacterium]|nr:DNA polymerase Y family protein [Burkholderiaceae bacterium]MDZ4144809.1 DNA polymerase Y family protein [Burkholderiales bacterium]
MHWIALQWPPDDTRAAWGWWALQFTPRVAPVDEALLLEVSASERLWGGRQPLLRRFFKKNPLQAPVEWSQGATSLIALAMLRLKLQGLPVPTGLPHGLPLGTLTAARPHVDTLARTGCTTWGALRALPRAGVARRFGAALVDALDVAWGERPDRHPWLTLPEVFDVKLELPALATTAPALMWSANRLLTQLQIWLQARQRGVLALELEWTLDLKRLNGAPLPPHQQLTLRTGRPTQDTAHLRRLASEHLARATLAAPASQLRLRTLDTAPWAGASQSLLPEDRLQGERLHALVERLSARLGAAQVRVPVARADHRPEHMQHWQAACANPGTHAAPPPVADALYPPWLLPQPLALQVHHGQPQFQGPLRLLTRAQRIETGWWDAAPAAGETGLALRDYFIARSPEAGLLWIYRERLSAPTVLAASTTESPPSTRWFLQGLYA